MPLTDLMTELTPYVRTYFWLTVLHIRTIANPSAVKTGVADLDSTRWKNPVPDPFIFILVRIRILLIVPKFTAYLYCIYLSILQIYTYADAVKICGTFWDTRYV